MSIIHASSVIANATRKPSAGATFSLSGTLMSPRTVSAFDLGMSASANAVWQVSAVSSGSPNFIDKGYMEKASYTGGSAAVYTNDNATDFASPKDFFSEIYVRATFQTGTGNPPDASSGMDTWLYVYNGTNFANRFWRWTAGPGFDTSSGTILLELCTVGNGTNIVASGYYRGVADTEL